MKSLNRGFGQYTLEELGPKVQAGLVTFTDALRMPAGPAREQSIAAAKENLRVLLNKLADNLEDTPGETDVTLATTGFDLRKGPIRSTEPPSIPQKVRLKASGISGTVQVIFGPSARAKVYEVEWTLTPEGPWQDAGVYSSSRSVHISGLTRGKDIWVRVRAIGPNETKSGWSDSATIMVT